MERGEVLFRERQGVKKKKIRGRQAGGLGSELVHVREREGEREKAAECVLYMYVCACLCAHVCVCVCARSVPFLSLFDY